MIANTAAQLVLPVNSLPASAAGSKVEFTATKTAEATSVNDIEISDGSGIITALDLNLNINDQPQEVFEQPVTVTVNIPKNLTLDVIKVAYTGTSYQGTAEKPAAPFDVTYDSASGDLTFKTWHFSPFAVMLTAPTRVFSFENGKGSFNLEPNGGNGTVTANSDGTLNVTVASSNGPAVSVRDLVEWTPAGITVASEIYVDPAAITGVFGVDVTMRSVAGLYATERRIAFAKQADGSIKVNPAHEAAKDISKPAISITEAGWYTAGLSYFAGENDKLTCRMFVLNSDGTKIAEWIHPLLNKVNSPAAPDFDGSFDGIGNVGSLWFLGSNAGAKLRSVRVYQNSGVRYAVASNEAQLTAALNGNADEIFVYNGTYNMMLDIRRDVTIIGQSRDGVVICGPADYNTLPMIAKRSSSPATETRDYYAVLAIVDADVTVKNLTVRGNINQLTANKSKLCESATARFTGVLVLDSSAVIDNVVVEDIRYDRLTGNSTMTGIYVCMQEGQTTTVRNTLTQNICKGNIACRVYGTFICENNTVIGGSEIDAMNGKVTDTAQNGIQIEGYSIVRGNRIVDFCYRGPHRAAPNYTTASGLMVVARGANGFPTNDLEKSVISGNTFIRCQTEIGTYGANLPTFWDMSKNTVTDSHAGCDTVLTLG